MENICQDIRVLSLYKQHYFDHYDPNMDNHYSCLGYYDGIAIKEIPSEDPEDLKKSENPQDSEKPGNPKKISYASHLFKKRSQACLSRVWSGTVYETAGLHGKHSEQIIGIFRCVDTISGQNQEKAEDAEKNSPYFALVFLQAQKHTDYKNIEKDIQKFCAYTDDLSRPYIHLSAYHTYDNADLVILIYSNSMKKMGEVLSEIRKNDSICYTHSIIGFSESYLSQCKVKNRFQVLNQWRGRTCFVDETIPHVTMKIATSGDPKAPEKFVAQIRKLSEDSNTEFSGENSIEFSDGAGHGHLRMDISGTNVKSLILLLAEDGSLNHRNSLFGRSVYNIETSLYWRSRNISELEENDIEEAKKELEKNEKEKNQKEENQNQPQNDDSHFRRLTEYYGRKMTTAWEDKDEGLFSYYSALAQVYNTLAQYEGFSMSRDIFSLLYPSVLMFEDLLGRAEQKKAERASLDIEESRKDSICEFVSAVNSVVYHTIHTDQIFLMIPGYSGNTYSIPVKLCLLYSWIIRKVITVLNDADYQYACLLTPELETRPVTTLINMGMFEDDRLIRFSSSQRSLYMPRHFIILITHEIGHYVGKGVRNRKLRLQCISRILVQLLFEGVFPLHYCQDDKMNCFSLKQKICLYLRGKIKTEAEAECLSLIYKKFAENRSERKEHATELLKIFKEICYELLEERGVIHNYIGIIPDGLEQKFVGENMGEVAALIYDIQNQLDRNRRILLSSQKIMNACISELIQVFREVYSDVSAFAILDYDYETFSEVFNVSEGMVSGSNSDVQRSVREMVIWDLIKKFGETQEEYEVVARRQKKEANLNSENEKIDDLNLMQEWPYTLMNELFAYKWIGDELKNYALESYNALRKQLKKHSGDRERIKGIYQIFTTSKASCSEIYDKIIDIIEEYNDEVRTCKK